MRSISRPGSSSLPRDARPTAPSRAHRRDHARPQQRLCHVQGRGRGKLDISGAFLLGGRQHADTTLVVDHACPTAPAASCSNA